MTKKSTKKPPDEKRISAHPLKTDEVLKALLDTKPPPKKKKDKKDS